MLLRRLQNRQLSFVVRFQVMEWQQRLEDLRLRDLRSRRNAEHWAKEVDHLRELTRSQALKVDQLEEETVRLENQMEQRQLDWETKEVELETLEDEAAKARRGDGGRGVKDMDSSKLTLPGRFSPVIFLSQNCFFTLA